MAALLEDRKGPFRTNDYFGPGTPSAVSWSRQVGEYNLEQIETRCGSSLACIHIRAGVASSL